MGAVKVPKETPSQRLQRQLYEARVEARENSERVRELLRYLALPKFHEDTTVQVGDVLLRLEGYVHPDCRHLPLHEHAWYSQCSTCGQGLQRTTSPSGDAVWSRFDGAVAWKPVNGLGGQERGE